MAAGGLPGDRGRKAVFFGRFISTPTPTDLSIRRGAVLVSSSRNGSIEKVNWDVSTVEDALKAFEVLPEDVGIIECNSEGFFFPGFVDTHIHAPQYPNVGLFGKSTLLDWLLKYTFPIESMLGNPNSPMFDESSRPQTSTKPDPLLRAYDVYTRVIQRTLAHGTTTATYYATNHVPATKLLFDLAYSHGQRAFIGRVCMDNPETCPEYYRDASTSSVLSAERECISHARTLDPHSTLVAPIITPRFAPSCTPSTLTTLSALASSENLRIQTHISENVSEVALVASFFPNSTSYADVYDSHGLLTPRTVLAHGVYLSPQERSLIKSRESKISHCPASNTALGSGICPVRILLDEGITVGLGTDVSGGYSPSILEAVRQACLVSRLVGFSNQEIIAATTAADVEKSPSPTSPLSPKPSSIPSSSYYNISVTEALYLGTVGGAKVLGLEDQIGGFDVGMKWDVQEIELGGGSASTSRNGANNNNNVDIFGWETWVERIEKWVWGGDDRKVRRGWVGGRCVKNCV